MFPECGHGGPKMQWSHLREVSLNLLFDIKMFPIGSGQTDDSTLTNLFL